MKCHPQYNYKKVTLIAILYWTWIGLLKKVKIHKHMCQQCDDVASGGPVEKIVSLVLHNSVCDISCRPDFLFCSVLFFDELLGTTASLHQATVSVGV